MSDYGVEKGQIYLAADGGRYGYVTLDHPRWDGDVLVRQFNELGWWGEPTFIDCFKLAQVRYGLVDFAPAWVPDSVLP
jgi:hypothetical protein